MQCDNQNHIQLNYAFNAGSKSTLFVAMVNIHHLINDLAGDGDNRLPHIQSGIVKIFRKVE